MSRAALFDRQGWPGGCWVDPWAPPIDRTLDLHVHAITQIKELVRPGRQRLATEGARPVHTSLAQLLDARLAVLMAAWELFMGKSGGRRVVRTGMSRQGRGSHEGPVE